MLVLLWTTAQWSADRRQEHISVLSHAGIKPSKKPCFEFFKKGIRLLREEYHLQCLKRRNCFGKLALNKESGNLCLKRSGGGEGRGRCGCGASRTFRCERGRHTFGEWLPSIKSACSPVWYTVCLPSQTQTLFTECTGSKWVVCSPSETAVCQFISRTDFTLSECSDCCRRRLATADSHRLSPNHWLMPWLV